MKRQPGKSAGGGFAGPLPYERRRRPQEPMRVPLWEMARFSGPAWLLLSKWAVEEDRKLPAPEAVRHPPHEHQPVE